MYTNGQGLWLLSIIYLAKILKQQNNIKLFLCLCKQIAMMLVALTFIWNHYRFLLYRCLFFSFIMELWLRYAEVLPSNPILLLIFLLALISCMYLLNTFSFYFTFSLLSLLVIAHTFIHLYLNCLLLFWLSFASRLIKIFYIIFSVEFYIVFKNFLIFIFFFVI